MSQNNNNAKKHGQLNAEKRAAKKAAVLGSQNKKRFPLIPIFATVAILIVGGIVLVGKTSKKTLSDSMPTASPTNTTQVTFPVDTFSDGKARHFAYDSEDDFTIKYFVLKSSDGIIRAAFDACDVCWPAGKGYSQSGDNMICRNCGRQLASVLVNEVKGGCNPAPLARKVENGRVVIEIADILTGKKYFDFASRG